jgi:hypothetical protein
LSLKKIGIVAATTAAAGGFVLGGAALADAAAKTPSPSATSGYPNGAPGASSDTPVTGDELAKVTAAMKAKDSTVTVTSVRKDPDGSYDVLGTKAGANVMYDVSADLKTFAQNTFGGGR